MYYKSKEVYLSECAFADDLIVYAVQEFGASREFGAVAEELRTRNFKKTQRKQRLWL